MSDVGIPLTPPSSRARDLLPARGERFEFLFPEFSTKSLGDIVHFYHYFFTNLIPLYLSLAKTTYPTTLCLAGLQRTSSPRPSHNYVLQAY